MEVARSGNILDGFRKENQPNLDCMWDMQERVVKDDSNTLGLSKGRCSHHLLLVASDNQTQSAGQVEADQISAKSIHPPQCRLLVQVHLTWQSPMCFAGREGIRFWASPGKKLGTWDNQWGQGQHSRTWFFTWALGFPGAKEHGTL